MLTDSKRGENTGQPCQEVEKGKEMVDEHKLRAGACYRRSLDLLPSFHRTEDHVQGV